MLKKFCTWFLVFAMVCALLMPFSAHAYSGLFSVCGAAVKNGEADIVIKITDNPSFAAFKMKITYEGNLTPMSVKKGTILSTGELTTSLDAGSSFVPGQITISFVNDVDITEDGDLFTIKFKVNQNIENYASVYVDYDDITQFVDYNGVPQDYSVVLGGGITTDYTIDFDARGGSAVASQNVAPSERVVKPADPTYGFDSFVGWYTDENLTQKYDFSQTVNDNIILYAKWSEDISPVAPNSSSQSSDYSIVTFDTGDFGSVANQRVPSGSKVAKPDYPSKWYMICDVAFNGWYADKALTQQYDFSQPVTESITIYAGWTGTMPLAPTSSKFSDIDKSDWFYGDVDYVVTAGIFGGTSETTFAPTAPMTRAMFVTALWRLDGNPNADINQAFADVDSNSYYAGAVAWATKNDIVSGIGGGLFGSNTEISRQDIAVILLRYLDYIKADYAVTMDYRFFADEDAIADYAKNSVQVMNKLGIIEGKGSNIIDPQGKATRAEVAAMLHRFMEFIK